MFSAKYSITTRVVITSNEVVCAYEEKLEDTKKDNQKPRGRTDNTITEVKRQSEAVRTDRQHNDRGKKTIRSREDGQTTQ
jgi:hypothetical protein